MILIFDIESFGIANRGHLFQGDYYGAFEGRDLRGVACLYNFGSMLLYAPDERLMPELAVHMAGLKRRPRVLMSRADWAEEVLARLGERGILPEKTEDQAYMVLGKEDFLPRPGPATRFAGPADLGTLRKLHRAFHIEYFGRYTEEDDRMGGMAESRMEGAGISVAEFSGEIVAKAEVLVRTDRTELIGGVFTLPKHRGKGFSKACMSLLVDRILRSRKQACLNVARNNLPALRVYRGLGFKRICDYTMAQFAP